MRARMESTSILTDIEVEPGKRVRCRRWNGETEGGVKFFAWIALLEVHKNENQAQFEAEMREVKVERELVSFDMRMVI